MNATQIQATQFRSRAPSNGWNLTNQLFSILSIIGMAAVMWAALSYAKPATNLAGDEQAAQRIFYLHMGSVMAALFGYVISLVGSIAYLITRNRDWDRATLAGVEIGTIFGICTTLAGSIWAKPAWNTYWTWDPRLTTVTITILIYIAYLLLRNGIENRETRARFSSIYALFAFLSIPLTYYSTRIFRTIHPVIINGKNPDEQGGFNVGPTMGQTVGIAALGFCLLFVAMLIMRWRQLRLEDQIAELQEEIE